VILLVFLFVLFLCALVDLDKEQETLMKRHIQDFSCTCLTISLQSVSDSPSLFFFEIFISSLSLR
jgi:hypothetical protein